MGQRATEYSPDTVSPPGDTLAELLRERGLSQGELADRMGMSNWAINEIIEGNVITSETALRLERTLGVPAEFWSTRDARYQERIERQRS